MQYDVVPLSTLDATLQWPVIEKIICKAVKLGGEYTTDELLKFVQGGDVGIWRVGDYQGIVVLKLQQRTYGLVLWIELVAGEDLPAWIETVIHALKETAKKMRCTTIETRGRLGWRKYLDKYIKPKGFKPVAVYYRCEV